jgi:hypothetical protein
MRSITKLDGSAYIPDFKLKQVPDEEIKNLPMRLRVVYLAVKHKGRIDDPNVLKDCMRKHPEYFLNPENDG